MLKTLSTSFVQYTKDTPAWKMAYHFFVTAIFATWIGALFLIVTNFQSFVDIYDRYRAEQVVQIEDALKVSQQTNELVADQRSRLGVDRLYVSKFHNGKVDLNGVHFIYISRISESTGPGISNEINRTQNLPLSIFPEMLTAISQNKCYYVEKVTDRVENSSFLTTMGVQSTMVCPIYDSSNKLIGLIGADGVIDPINKSDAPSLEASLQTVSGVLGSLLIQ